MRSERQQVRTYYTLSEVRYRVGPRESCVSNVYCFSRRSHCSVSAAPPADNTTHRTHKQGTSDGTRHRFAVARSRHTIPQEHSRPVSPGRATPLALGQVSPVESILCRLVPASRTCPIPPPGIPAIFLTHSAHATSDQTVHGQDVTGHARLVPYYTSALHSSTCRMADATTTPGRSAQS